MHLSRKPRPFGAGLAFFCRRRYLFSARERAFLFSSAKRFFFLLPSAFSSFCFAEGFFLLQF